LHFVGHHDTGHTLLKFRLIPFTITFFALSALAVPAVAQQDQQAQQIQLPDAPSVILVASAAAPDTAAAPETHYPTLNLDIETALFGAPATDASDSDSQNAQQTGQSAAEAAKQSDKPRRPTPPVEVDANGNPIPLDRQQPHRILGFMPNFRSVSGGAVTHPPGWKYNFTIATRQSFDYSSFIFLGITSLSAEGINSHPVLGKGVDGFYAYIWRGFLDKTDGTYIGAWFLPSLLHEDTRYYAMGNERSVPIRILYVMSRQVVTRTYGERQTPNIAGLGGKVLTQIVSREYYPAGSTSFGVLATKFAYSAMRDIAFTSIREFYPDIAAHYVRKHREKLARLAAQSAGPQPTATPAPETPSAPRTPMPH
jgi:hypothetical protein